MKDKKRLSSERSWCQQGVRYFLRREYEVIKELRSQFSVKSLCKVMGVNRSGYYKWLHRGKNQYEFNRDYITKLAKVIHNEYPSYGYHAIASKIRDKTGWVISDNLVHKCCKMAKIKSKIRHYQYRRPGGEHVVYENKIQGNWKTTRPLEKIVSDMTVIAHRGTRYEWTYFLDVYNNSIIAWDISNKAGDIKPYYTCRNKLLEIIKKEELQTPLYFHTDQGTVYSSKAYNQALLDYNIIRSMSRAGTPTDNPVIESINGWIKAQIKCDYKINEWDSIRDFIEYYVHYFNYARPSYKLRYKNPAQFTLSRVSNSLFNYVYFSLTSSQDYDFLFYLSTVLFFIFYVFY